MGQFYHVAYFKKLNMVMSCGADGKLLLWTFQMREPMRGPEFKIQGVFTYSAGSFAEGQHAWKPSYKPVKIFKLPTVSPLSAEDTSILQKPTIYVWKDDGHNVLVTTSSSCIWKLSIASGE